LGEGFSVVTAPLSAQEWQWLGALAAERGLPPSLLAKLAGTGRRELDHFLQRGRASGLLSVGPQTAVLPSAISEPLFSVGAEYAQLVLRTLSEQGALDAIAAQTEGLLGSRSVSNVTMALCKGDLLNFLRRVSVPRPPRPGLDRDASAWLRESVCEPFDAVWLEHTWGDEALYVAGRVLQDALHGASPCRGLYCWALANAAACPHDEARQALIAALCQHAALRGDADGVRDLARALPPVQQFGYDAAAAYISGDLITARRLLDAAFDGPLGAADSSRSGVLLDCGALTPLHALILHARGAPSDIARAKRLLAVANGEHERRTSRAFRTLLRYLADPACHHQRLDVSQLRSDAGIWEVLLTALTVHLQSDQPTMRARWAQYLMRKAAGFRDAGYAWLSDQSVLLAMALDSEQRASELATDTARAENTHGKVLSLADMLTPKPEWRKTLDALAQVSDAIHDVEERCYRVAWFVDMADGSLSRPALEEYRATLNVWSQGRRLTLAELYERREELPAEDARVLECSRETVSGRREFTAEAHEMLVGHPRVFNGARGRIPVQVVRGTSRIETDEEPGFIRISVEPQGAQLGINVVAQGDDRLIVYRVSAAMCRVLEVLPHGVRVPIEQQPELLGILGRLSQSIDVRSDQLGAEQVIAADSRPCLRLRPVAGAWSVHLGVRPFGEGGRFFLPGTGRRTLATFVDGQRLRCERDFDLERTRAENVIAVCPTLAQRASAEEGSAESREWVLDEQSVLSVLAELRDGNAECELEWPESAALRLRGRASSRQLHGRLRSDKGWYLASGGVRLEDLTELALSELVRAEPIGGGRFVRLPSGDYVEVEAKLRRVMAALRAVGTKKSDGGFKVHRGAVAALRELTTGESPFDLDGDASEWLARVERVAQTTFPVPDTLRAELRSYQVEGYRWLRSLAELGLGGCLADDMGLGKTVQVLALLLSTHHAGPALVVAPTSVCANWVREMQRFAPSLTPVEYVGKDRASLLSRLGHSDAREVLVCSYALLQQDAAELCSVDWATAVLDEAQFIKNAESLRARAAYQLRATQRVALTGTPVENHYGDLWSIFRFLNPGLLGTYAEFKRQFVLPIERDGNASPAATLRELTQPYILRRVKREVLPELPALTEVQHDVALSNDEAVRYALLRKNIHDKLFTTHGKRHNKLEVLAELTRLRRFCCHPKLIFPDAPSESGKLKALLDLVEELRANDHRALVFSQYVDFLGLVRERLDECSISYEYLDGSTPEAQRQARVDAFQNGSATLFLISLKAGGFGLNLTAADYVIHLDPWWNPAVQAQATDRAHRIGQDRPVTVYRLVTRDTIEEDIVKLHSKKQDLAQLLLGNSVDAPPLTTDALLLLLQDATTAHAPLE
jgi:superfamily II DNA or RNA helicase